ncbi:MAG: hypothetical protein J5614_01450 [Paludibacteraceae bacterium]|nr:hypothetical protein [Paludibacteraceae bacterium]MBR6596420.1 hypothetical protein [Paludibacteraceae bacterium]
MLSKEKLEQLREWFLKESPIDAVLSFKDKCGRLLESPKTFIEMISDDETINSMSDDLSKILTVQKQLVEIKDFLDQNQESEGGYSPFEYLFVSKTKLSEEKIEFIKEQYIFFKKINAIASQIKQNNSKEDYEAFVEQVIPLLEKTCGNRDKLDSYLEEYAEFMGDCLTVEEANERFKQLDNIVYVMDQNAYESFLQNGKVIIDQVEAYKKKETKTSEDGT